MRMVECAVSSKRITFIITRRTQLQPNNRCRSPGYVQVRVPRCAPRAEKIKRLLVHCKSPASRRSFFPLSVIGRHQLFGITLHGCGVESSKGNHHRAPPDFASCAALIRAVKESPPGATTSRSSALDPPFAAFILATAFMLSSFAPSAPDLRCPAPSSPRSARSSRRCRKAWRVLRPRSPIRTTSPPRPPSPRSGRRSPPATRRALS